MEVTLKIFRYNPEVDKKFHYETYTFDAEETDRILDLLEHVKGYMDGTLSFRRSCAHGVCGSDAMRINGRNMLACKTLVRDVGTTITVEPILGLKVVKDLIVDMEPFFDNYKKMLPYLINDSPLPAGWTRAPPVARAARPLRRHDQVHPVRGLHHLLPVVLGQRRILRSCRARDRPPLHLRQPRRGRLPSACTIITETNGLARCHTIYNCTNACPRDIQITKAIGELKMSSLTGRID